jgi:hypothetical protein
MRPTVNLPIFRRSLVVMLQLLGFNPQSIDKNGLVMGKKQLSMIEM